MKVSRKHSVEKLDKIVLLNLSLKTYLSAQSFIAAKPTGAKYLPTRKGSNISLAKDFRSIFINGPLDLPRSFMPPECRILMMLSFIIASGLGGKSRLISDSPLWDCYLTPESLSL